MGSVEAIRIGVGETRSFFRPDGSKVSIGRIRELPVQPTPEKNNTRPSETALHEAGHVTVGMDRNVGIDGADIKPSGNALGRTYPDSFDAPTAAAGQATGTGGAGHDLYLIEAHGMSTGSAVATATSILRKRDKEFMAIANALDKNKALTRGQINSIFTDAGEEKRKEDQGKTAEIEVFIKQKDGGEEKIRLEVPNGQTIIDIPLPPSGDIFVAEKHLVSKAA